MSKEKISEMSDEALVKRAKLMNATKTYDAVIIGVACGIVIYSAVKHGIGLFTLLPLVYLPVLRSNTLKRDALNKELKARNLA